VSRETLLQKVAERLLLNRTGLELIDQLLRIFDAVVDPDPDAIGPGVQIHQEVCGGDQVGRVVRVRKDQVEPHTRG